MEAATRKQAQPGAGGDMVSALLGVWMLSGAALDAWAHVNDPSLDPFFTPWHGVLYTGFAAMVIRTLSARRLGDRRLYRTSLTGLIVFGVGGLSDLAWHSAFGVERQLEAVASPPHVLLFVGGVLVLSGPFRRAWSVPRADGSLRTMIPALLSAASVGALVMLMFFHASPFLPTRMGGQLITSCDVESCPLIASSYNSQQGWLVAVLLTNVIMAPVIVLPAHRWRLPFPTFTPLVLIMVATQVAISGFSQPVPLAAAGLAAVPVDAMYLLFRPTGSGARLVSFAAVALAAFWLSYLIVIRMAYGVHWPPELMFGIVAWTAVTGAGIAGLIASRPTDEEEV